MCAWLLFEWVLFLANKWSQDRLASIISPMTTSNIYKRHLCSKSRVYGPGIRNKAWGFCDLGSWHHANWFICHWCLTCRHVFAQFSFFAWGKNRIYNWYSPQKSDFPSGVEFQRFLTGSPESWNGSKISDHTIGQGLFFPPPKGVDLTFPSVTKVAVFSSGRLWWRPAHGVLFEECQLVLQDPAGPTLSRTVPEMGTAIFVEL